MLTKQDVGEDGKVLIYHKIDGPIRRWAVDAAEMIRKGEATKDRPDEPMHESFDEGVPQ